MVILKQFDERKKKIGVGTNIISYMKDDKEKLKMKIRVATNIISYMKDKEKLKMIKVIFSTLFTK